MFVILVYDVGSKRDHVIMKLCRKYLRHTQKSVFEGIITEAKLNALKKELESKIEKKTDTIRIFEFESLKYAYIEEIGVVMDSGSNIL